MQTVDKADTLNLPARGIGRQLMEALNRAALGLHMCQMLANVKTLMTKHDDYSMPQPQAYQTWSPL